MHGCLLPMPVKVIRRIIWAINAFEESSEIQSHTEKSLKSLVKQTSASVEPVFVLTPDQINLDIESEANWVEFYRSAARKQILQQIKNIKGITFSEPTILFQKRSSITSAVKMLATYALRKKVDIIVVGTHARKGVSRLFLGSFAETLLMHSKVPIFIVNPTTQAGLINRHILFATDFNEKAYTVFRRIILLAQSLKAKLTIFHAVLHPVEPFLASGALLLGGVWQASQNDFDDQKQAYIQKANKWAEEAKKLGVLTKIQISNGGVSVPYAVLKFANQNKVGLIAIAAKSGLVASTLIGSVTRQIVRNSKCPIWVIHQ